MLHTRTITITYRTSDSQMMWQVQIAACSYSKKDDHAGIAWSAKVNRQDQLSEQPEPLLEK